MALNVVLFGATGMVGQGVCRECLRDDRVETVLAVGRTATGRRDPKLTDVVVPDLFRIDDVRARLGGLDACFFCLGVSSAGLDERAYTRLTFDLTLAIADMLARLNPSMVFVYVSGAGTDGTGRGRVMWARVKGRTEDALRQLPFRSVYLFRPGAIQPLHGIRSRTPWVQTLYTAMAPLWPLARRLVPNAVTTTEQLGRAMIGVSFAGHPKPILETRDINSIR